MVNQMTDTVADGIASRCGVYQMTKTGYGMEKVDFQVLLSSDHAAGFAFKSGVRHLCWSGAWALPNRGSR